MANPRRTNRNRNSQTNTPPPVNIGDAETSQSVQEAERSYTRPNNPTDNQHKIKLWFINKENQPTIANLISFLMFCATVWLVFYTVGLFNKTSIQAEQSIKAANAAISSDSLAKIQIDSMRSGKKQSDIADAKRLKRDTDFINKQKSGIDAQIAAISEQQKEFEIENKPMIQVAPVRIDSVNSVSKIVVYGAVNNFGKQPAKIIYMKIKSVYSELDGFSDFVYFPKKETNVNMYLPGNSNFPISLRHDSIEPEARINKMLNGKAFEYFIGEVKYINTVTNQTMLYRFNFRISVYPYYNILSIVDTTFNRSIHSK